MQPTVQKITELFAHQRRFVVPLFQRQYVWKQDEQWWPLWRDILRQVGKLIVVGSNETLPSDANHFMGAIVIQSETQEGGGALPTFTIIDGQQRLVTFQIMLAAIRDHLQRMADPFFVRFQSLTENLPPFEKEEDKFKVWPTNRDRGGSDAINLRYNQRRSELPRLAQTYQFFADAFDRYMRAVSPGDLEDDHDDPEAICESSSQQRVQALFQALSYSLRFVVIELGEEEDPQIIFESLNARGEPLLPSDLIKNYLFLEAGSDAETAYEQYWEDFEAEAWLKKIRGLEVRQLQTRSMIDIFFHTYLVMQPNRAEVNIDRLYIEFRDWRVKTKSEKSINELLEDIQRNAAGFEKAVRLEGTSPAARCMRAILATDDFVAMPLLTHLLARELSSVAESKIFAALESFIVRRWFCEEKQRNRSFSQSQASLYAKITEQVTTVDNRAVESQFASMLVAFQQRGRAAWPTDDEFRSGWRSRTVCYDSRKERAGLVLDALAAKVRADWPPPDRGNMEVEHILPLGADENTYPFSAPNQTYRANDDLRKLRVNTIGNLVLLERGLNQIAGNQTFQLKRGVYGDSVAPLLDFVRKQSKWAEEEIANRADDLFEAALAVWPR